MLILYRLLCPKVHHILLVRKMCGAIQQTLFPWSPDDPVDVVSGSVDLPYPVVSGVLLHTHPNCSFCWHCTQTEGVVHQCK